MFTSSVVFLHASFTAAASVLASVGIAAGGGGFVFAGLSNRS